MPTVSDAWPALLLMGVILSLPWLARLVRKSGWQGLAAPSSPMKVVSALAVGPQQRILTVEVGSGAHKKWLILGVTSQTITKLDTLPVNAHQVAETLASHAHDTQAHHEST